jgi:GNAT superfamily N-acetyltransferase
VLPANASLQAANQAVKLVKKIPAVTKYLIPEFCYNFSMVEIIAKYMADLQPDESAQIDLVSNLAYASYTPEMDGLDWAPPEIAIWAQVDSTIVSLLFLVQREITVGEQPVGIGGLGGVATHPDYQRRGYAAQVMRYSETYMRETMQVPFGLLVCHTMRRPYYEGLGWVAISEPMVFDFRGQTIQWVAETMYLPLTGQAWPAGIVNLLGNPW